jgi:hypothetical protein
MDWLDGLMGIFGGGSVGMIVGAVGSYLNKKQAIEQERINNEHEKQMAEITLKEKSLDRQHEVNMADKQIDIAESEGKIQIDLAETNAFVESQKTSHPWMEIARAIMRPLITGGLIIWLMILTFNMSRLIGGLDALPTDTIISMYSGILTDLSALTMMSTSWWFGSRPQRRV